MSLGHGSQIIRDGLVLYYDTSNTQRSYVGEPTTNLTSNPIPTSTAGYTSAGGTGSLTFVTDSVRWVRTGYETWGAYLNTPTVFNGTLSTTAQYTMSFEWKSEGQVNSSILSYQLVQGNGQSPASIAYNLNSNSVEIGGGWKRFKATFTPGNTGISAYNRIYLGPQGSSILDFYIKKVKFESKSYATPFTADTRSTTQAILDLIGNNTITANSLTYDSSGTFSFNGSTNNIQVANPVPSNLPYTVIQWVKPTTPLTDTIVTNGTGRKTPLVGPGPQWSPGYWLTARNFRVHAYTEYRDHTIDWVGNTDWHMIGQVFNGTNCYGIVDGAILSGGTRTSYSPGLQTNILIGAENTTGNVYNWNGRIDSTQIYNRALSQAEIKQNFEALRGRYGI